MDTPIVDQSQTPSGPLTPEEPTTEKQPETPTEMEKAVPDTETEVALQQSDGRPNITGPKLTTEGKLAIFHIQPADPATVVSAVELRVQKQDGPMWKFETSTEYKNNFSVWGAGTFDIQARTRNGAEWSEWSKPFTVICLPN